MNMDYEQIRLDLDRTPARLTLLEGNRSVPVLDRETLESLDGALERLKKHPPDVLLVCSENEETFCPGADVDELAEIQSRKEAESFARRGQLVLDRLAKLDTFSVAAVNGDCLGGGLELALACDALLLKNDPEIGVGLPEVKLGIIPGFGGTQRLPRRIGVQNALKVILTGRKHTPRQAIKLDIADRLLPPEGFSSLAERIATHWHETDKTFDRGSDGLWTSILEGTGPGRSILFREARNRTKERTGSHYPAPFAAIDAVEKGLDTSLEEGLKIEAKTVAELAGDKTTRAMMDLYQKTEEVSEIPEDTTTFDWERSGVIGAGTMGGAIAQLFAYHGYRCRLKDIAPDPLRQGLQKASSLFQKGVDNGRWSSASASDRMKRISPTLEWDGFQQTDVMIECVPEKISLKKDVLLEMEQSAGPDTILATNTSSIPLSELRTTLDHPENFLGIHFFNPVYKMPLVEVIRHGKTDPEVVQRARKIAADLGKTPVVVEDRPGFLVNRLLFFYLQEALLLFQEGVEIERIDEILKDFGMPQGPFEVLDQVGLDVASDVAETLTSAFGDRVPEIDLIDKLVEKGWLGKKSGVGFYRYDNDDNEPNQDVRSLLARSERNPDRMEIRDRTVLALVNEAIRAVNQQLVAGPDVVDVAMVLGTGFAPFRGGPWNYADDRGWEEVRERLETFRNKFGDRFTPANPFPNGGQSPGGPGNSPSTPSETPGSNGGNPSGSGSDSEPNPDREENETDETNSLASSESPEDHTSTGETGPNPKSHVSVESPDNIQNPDENVALVFSGGGARGAYEAGVLNGLSKYVFPEMEGRPNINILVGTSAGAVNAFYLGSRIQDFHRCTSEMVEIWGGLELEDTLVPHSAISVSLYRWLLGSSRNEQISLLDPSYIQNLIQHDFPWENITTNIEEGPLKSLCVTATSLNSGQTRLFVEAAYEDMPPLPYEQQIEWEPTRMQPQHVFASSSIPLFFPATRIDGVLYYDGGLRQNVPITPAVSLGADKVFVVGVKSPDPKLPEQVPELHEESYPGAPHIIGKIMDAILLDPVERERRRLFVLKQLLREGKERFGESFALKVSELLIPYVGGDLGTTEFYFHRPEQDLGAEAREHIPKIRDQLGGIWGRVFHEFAADRSTGDWDLASYVLFDREYTEKLIDLGEQNVEENADDIRKFFTGEKYKKRAP